MEVKGRHTHTQPEMKQAHRGERDPAVHTVCTGSSGGSLFSQNPRLHLGHGHSVENGRHTGLRPLSLPTGLSDTWANTFHLQPVRHRLQTHVSSALSWLSLLVKLGASKAKALLSVPICAMASCSWQVFSKPGPGGLGTCFPPHLLASCSRRACMASSASLAWPLSSLPCVL